jgi:hypothetical protein
MKPSCTLEKTVAENALKATKYTHVLEDLGCDPTIKELNKYLEFLASGKTSDKNMASTRRS